MTDADDDLGGHGIVDCLDGLAEAQLCHEVALDDSLGVLSRAHCFGLPEPFSACHWTEFVLDFRSQNHLR